MSLSTPLPPLRGRWRTIVLDDDPTGTQTVSGLPVVLTPDLATLRDLAERWSGPVWVLTNTRALAEGAAVLLLASVVDDVHAAFGGDVTLVLRGDSTLRGHVLAEIDVLSSHSSVSLFVPAFVEQGRVTVGGIHYVEVDGVRIEVGRTEYAHDAAFGYRSSNLVDWVHEHDPGRPAAGVTLEALRAGGGVEVRDVLVAAEAGTVVVPDAETVADLEAIGRGWTWAREAGRPVVLRCASSLASIVTGSSARLVDLPAVDGPVLVVCASHTSGATEQLRRLLAQPGTVSYELDLGPLLVAGVPAAEAVEALAAEVSAAMERHRVVVLSTPREPDPAHLDLASGAAIMDLVVAVVAGVDRRPAAVVSKGGITSARVARDGLGARTATVVGQPLAGVPLWQLDLDDGSTLAHVVVPGNIGSPDTLVAVVSALTA